MGKVPKLKSDLAHQMVEMHIYTNRSWLDHFFKNRGDRAGVSCDTVQV